jgi:chlorobactene glucosyltransferase
MTILEWILRLLLVLVGLSWLLNALHLEDQRRRGRWTLRPSGAGPRRTERVSVLVPARDEERNIEACLRQALAQDHPELEVIVVDDGSTDGTAAILAALVAEQPHRLKVIRGEAGGPPEGWLGKPWACQRAGQQATGDWLLFIDADVRLHPRAVSVALGWAQDHGLDLLSGLGRMEAVGPWEKILQPSVGALILAGNDLNRVNDPARRGERPLANGQFLLFHASAWRELGGHQAVAGAVLDDVGMASAVAASGGAYELVMMRELFGCRMYDSLGALWQGWTKNLFIGIRRSLPLLLFITAWVFCGSVLPFLLLPAALLGWLPPDMALLSLLVCGIVLGLRRWMDGLFGNDRRYGLSLPLASLMLIALFWNSALRTWTGTVSWKGRRLDLARSEGR